MTAHIVKEDNEFTQYAHKTMEFVTNNIPVLVVSLISLVIIMFLIGSLGSCVGSGRAY